MSALLVTREGFQQIYPDSIDLDLDRVTHRVGLVNMDAYNKLWPPFDLDPEDAVGTYEVTTVDGTDIARQGQEKRYPVLLWKLEVDEFTTWDEVLAARPNFCEWGERGWKQPFLSSGVSDVELVSAARATELGLTTAGKTPVGSYLPTGADWTFRSRNANRPQPVILFDRSKLASA